MAYKGMEYLKNKLNAKRPRIKKRYDYYEQKDLFKSNNILLPPTIANKFESVLGWCSKTVDSVDNRMNFRGFRNDEYNLEQIFNNNNPDVLFDSAIRCALISSCSFIYIRKDEYNLPAMEVIDGYNATGIVDESTHMLIEGYAVLDKDTEGNVLTEAYFTREDTTFYEKGKEPYSIDNIAPFPLLVPIIYKPDAVRPFGHSRISRACMSLQDNAKEILIDSIICSEFYSFPQKYVLGMDADAEPIDKYRAAITSLLQINGSADTNRNPTVGQFSQASMEPYQQQLKSIASLFAGESGLTLDDLGFPSANPQSYEAIQASHDELRGVIIKAQKSFGRGFLNAGYLSACIRDDHIYNRGMFVNTVPIWEPAYPADARTLASLGDAASKINTAIPGYFTEENFREFSGIPKYSAEDDEDVF